jgi:two-component system nitrate/nitrite response regulator NarL
VVDDHPIARAGVIYLLNCHDWLTVIGYASDGEEGLQKARDLSPDLVLVDIMLPKLSGLALAKVLRVELPQTRVIILSLHPPARVAPSVIATGAHGYVCKSVATGELIRAIETVGSGGKYFGVEFNHIEKPERRSLSPREREVLACVAEGLLNKEIADRLGVGIRTVQTYRDSLMRKLNIHSVAGLTVFAIQHGLVIDEPDREARAQPIDLALVSN